MPREDAAWLHVELLDCLNNAVCDGIPRFGPRYSIEFTQLDEHVRAAHVDVDALELTILQAEEVAVAHPRFLAVALLKIHIELRGDRVVVDIRHVMKVFVNAGFVGREEGFEHLANSRVAPFMIGKRGLDRKDRIGREAIDYRLPVGPINIGDLTVMRQNYQIVAR